MRTRKRKQLKRNSKNGLFILRVFYKPHIQVSFRLGNAAHPAVIGVLPEGEAVGGIGQTGVISVPDDCPFQAGHVQNIGLSGRVRIYSGGIPRFFYDFTEGNTVIGKLFAADIVDPCRVILDDDLRVIDDRKCDLDSALLNDIEAELGLLPGFLFGHCLGKDIDADIETGLFGVL